MFFLLISIQSTIGFISVAKRVRFQLFFAQFKALVENLLSSTIKTLQVDGGTEFLPILRSYPAI
jgi:hypothetical protein